MLGLARRLVKLLEEQHSGVVGGEQQLADPGRGRLPVDQPGLVGDAGAEQVEDQALRRPWVALEEDVEVVVLGEEDGADDPLLVVEADHHVEHVGGELLALGGGVEGVAELVLGVERGQQRQVLAGGGEAEDLGHLEVLGELGGVRLGLERGALEPAADLAGGEVDRPPEHDADDLHERSRGHQARIQAGPTGCALAALEVRHRASLHPPRAVAWDPSGPACGDGSTRMLTPDRPQEDVFLPAWSPP